MKLKNKTKIIAIIIISIMVCMITIFFYKSNDLKNTQAKAVESVERTSIENIRSECINRQQEESKRKTFVKALEEQKQAEKAAQEEQAKKVAQEEHVSAKSLNSETDTNLEQEPEPVSTALPNQAAFDNYISMVPANVMNHLYSDGWTLTLVTDAEVANIAADRGMSVEGQIGAMAMSDTKQIVVANRCPEKVIHEIGHAMMCTYTPYIVTSVINTCNAEKEAYIATFAPEPHNVSTTEEILAEAYIQYVLNGSTLQANCPGIYQILAEQTNRM